MKSPFPGMDPYLERHWGNVHQSAITYIRDSLQPRLPGNLRARTQKRVFIDVPDPLRGEYYPDVRAVERPKSSRVVGSSAIMAEAPSETENEVETGNANLPAAKPMLIFDYKAEPDPSLKTADAKWADALLRELGRR